MKIFVSKIVRIAIFCSKILKAAVGRSKLASIRQTILFMAILLKEGYPFQNLLLVATVSAQDVGLRQNGQQIAAHRLADQKGKTLRVIPVNKVKRRLMVPDQGAYLFSCYEVGTHLPKNSSGIDCASRRVPPARNAASLLSRTGRFGLIV